MLVRTAFFALVMAAAGGLATPATALQIVIQENVSLSGVLGLEDEGMGCEPADALGVVHCAGGPLEDPVVLPEFRLDSWEIAAGPGAKIDVRFSVTDLGTPEPKAAAVIISGPERIGPIGPANMTLLGSLEVTDANGDGTAAVLPFPASVCACDASGTVLAGSFTYPHHFLPIDLPVVSSVGGTARTQSVLVVPFDDVQDGSITIYFTGDVSSGDTAVVQLSLSVLPVPEPMPLLLVSIGTVALAVPARFR